MFPTRWFFNLDNFQWFLLTQKRGKVQNTANQLCICLISRVFQWFLWVLWVLIIPKLLIKASGHIAILFWAFWEILKLWPNNLPISFSECEVWHLNQSRSSALRALAAGSTELFPITKQGDKTVGSAQVKLTYAHSFGLFYRNFFSSVLNSLML